MGYHRPDIGQQAIHYILDFQYILYPVVNKENLSTTAHLIFNGLFDDLLIEGMQFGDDGVTVGRWCIDDGEVPGSHQRELKGSGNGSGCQGKGVHIQFQLLQFLLHTYPELLFLINDE